MAEEEAEERWRGKRVLQELDLDDRATKNKNHQRSSSSSSFRPSADNFLLHTYSFGKVSNSRCINRRRGSMMFPKQGMKGYCEPRSPEVSCFGRVLVLDHTTKEQNNNKSMWWTCGIGGLAHCCGRQREERKERWKRAPEMMKNSPPLDLARFKSGRRSFSWDGADLMSIHTSNSNSNSKQHQRVEIWRRRSLGQLHPLDIANTNCTLNDSDDDVGPSSI